MGGLDDLQDIVKQFGKEVSDNLLPNFTNAWDNMTNMATALNKVFGQNRQRILEIQQAVGDTIPGITKLGGSVNDAFSTMKEISEATKRNVIATSEDATKLFAANQILGSSVGTIVSEFTKVGVQFSQIGPQLETSINRIQNLGLNTSQIFSDVESYMGKLNEFNFTGGVDGLAKMASHAAMFRFDMRDTFNLAERALKPEGAIALASAFQRMGVAASDLTDPFQLMYKSLNDPSGLQDSLAKMTQQYVEFDEKTKTFQINPMGMLQLRELGEQTNLSYQNLAESAKAVANLDRALGQIKPGINFASEEDKQLIGNIATMNKQGDYVVNVKNELGESVPKKLSELTQPQIDEIIELQKEKGKLKLEDIAVSQLDAQTAMVSNIAAIRQKVEYGVVTAPQITSLSEKLRDFNIGATDILEKKVGSTKDIRPQVKQTIDDIVGMLKEGASGKLTSEQMKQNMESITQKFNVLEKNSIGGFKDIVKELDQKYQQIFDKGSLKTNINPSFKPAKPATTNSLKVDYDGTIVFKIEAGAGVNTTDLERWANSSDFRKKMIDVLANLDDNAKRKIGLIY
jgi:flagellar biosynthesis/type III secretory pathway chaperone